MSVEAWSTSAILNSSAPPAGFPEGMQPADVNNSARQVMADVATLVRQLPWLLLTTGRTLVRTGNLQFQITGADDTGIYTIGRRIRSRGASTVYGVVTSSSFGAGNTTVNVTMDGAANLPNPLTAIDVADTDANVLQLDSAGKLIVGVIPSLPTSQITSGTFADARISASSVTQHRVALVTSIGTVNFNGTFTAGTFTDLNTYGSEQIRFDLDLGLSSSGTITILTDSNNGASPDTGATDYAYSAKYESGGSVLPSRSTGAAAILLTPVNVTAAAGLVGTVYVQRLGGGSLRPMIRWEIGYESSTGDSFVIASGIGARRSTTAINAISFVGSSNFTNGSYITALPHVKKT